MRRPDPPATTIAAARAEAGSYSRTSVLSYSAGGGSGKGVADKGADVLGGDDADPGRRRARHGAGGEIGGGEAHARGLGQAALHLPHRPHLAAQPQLADEHG